MSATLTSENVESVPLGLFEDDIPPTATGRKRWTWDQCAELLEAHLVSPGFRLIDGEIFQPDGSRKLWALDDCEWMENAGLLHGRFELLEGEIVVNMGQRGLHASAVMLIIAYLLGTYGKRRVRTQATVEIRENEVVQSKPEPDVAVLRLPGTQTPQASDILLAVEVCDSTQRDDFGPKQRLYARAGIQEYWVLDLQNRNLVVFRRPQGDTWGLRREYEETESVAPLSAPEALVTVSDLLP